MYGSAASGALDVADGLVEPLPPVGQHVAEVVERRGVQRVLRQHLPELPLGVREPLLTVRTPTPANEAHGEVAGELLRGPREDGQGRVVPRARAIRIRPARCSRPGRPAAWRARLRAAPSLRLPCRTDAAPRLRGAGGAGCPAGRFAPRARATAASAYRLRRQLRLDEIELDGRIAGRHLLRALEGGERAIGVTELQVRETELQQHRKQVASGARRGRRGRRADDRLERLHDAAVLLLLPERLRPST